MKASNKFVTALADGWSISPIYQVYTGLPYDGLVSGSNGGAGSLNRSGGQNRLVGLVERNAFTGPTVKNLDLRLSRRFYIKEKVNVEFLGEVFNLPNSVQITGINGTMYNLVSGGLTYNTAFGTINEAGGTLYRERQVQLGLRFQF